MGNPVRIGGFFSSFDTEAVIAQLTQARQSVLIKLDVQEASATQKKATLSGIQAKFTSLMAKLTTLLNQNSVTGKTATVTGTGVAAAAGPNAALGTFAVDILKLASPTQANGRSLTSPIDPASPMDASNFGNLPSAGSFTISTATGGLQKFTIGGTVAQTATLLNASNFAIAPTAGSYTISTATGGTATLTLNPATQTLADVVTAINGTAVGVTASITNDANGRANILSLTSTQGSVTLGASTDTSNFWTATNLTASVPGATRASLNAFTKMMSLNNVIGEINASAIGVTASITNDVNGKANLISLSSASGAINLGNASDTSNFLTATSLIASPAGTTRTSTQPMARLNPTSKMGTASFDGGVPAAGTHTVTINGVDIAYNAATDSLLDFVGRVNSSAAGVSLRYDSQTDSVNMQQLKTGSVAVTLADDGAGGNLLAKLGLIAATQTLGSNAEYKIDGGATQYSATNTVTNNGTTVTLNAVTTPGTPASVVVTQDSTSALAAVKAFVTEFNAVMTAIDAATKADGSKTGNKSGPLSGDSSLRVLKSTLRGIMTSSGVNVGGKLTTMSQIGLSFGAVGSALGTTNTLQLDETKFKDALTNDPGSVQSVLTALKFSSTLAPGGTGSIASITGTYSGNAAGTYAITDDGLGNLTSVFTPTNGGAAISTSAVVQSAGTNSTLIPGMTLSINALLTAGSHTISVSASSQSVVQRIKDFVDLQAGLGGVLQKRQDTYTAVTKSLADRKIQIQAHIDAEMSTLRKKFARMEQAQARAQGIQSSLTQTMNQLSASPR